MRERLLAIWVLAGIGWGAWMPAWSGSIRSLWDEKPAPRTHTSASSVRTLWQSPAASTSATSTAPSAHSSTRPIGRLWQQSASAPNAPSRSGDTVSRIQTSRQSLRQTTSEQAKKNQQLAQIAQEIKRVELESIAIDKVLARLAKDLKANQSRYESARQSIDAYSEKIAELDRVIERHHEQFVQRLADQFALVAALKAINRTSIETIVQQEFYEDYKLRNDDELARLKREIDTRRKARQALIDKQHAIASSIQSITQKHQLYAKKKREKAALLAALAQKEQAYRLQLKRIIERQNLLRQTLAKLNIVRKEELQRAKAAEKAQQAELARKTKQLNRMRKAERERIKAARARGKEATYVAPEIKASTSIRQYGSSYQASNIHAYRGPKTISPIAGARVVKRFGTYTDPIYKIKIFNDNVVLRAPKEGAMVHNVLNGKVVYVGKNSMLGKVVIVEHGRRLHTIYAALDRIAPLLKTGKRVKRGAVIGRVKRKLIFQATQNSKYINPLRLIRL